MAEFEDEHVYTAPSLFVKEDLTTDPEDEAKLLAFYRRSAIIHKFVKILSNSPEVVHLDMSLHIEVLARYDMSMDSDSEQDDDSSVLSLTGTKRAQKWRQPTSAP